MRSLEELFHQGELEAQRRFEGELHWGDSALPALNNILRESLDADMARYIEQRRFFFIATADDKGECDCSFRGTERDANGEQLAAIRVVDATRLIFPDYRGNTAYNSLGNILTNPHLGLLFIDFENSTRLRLNGRAEILERDHPCLDYWPNALRFIQVSLKQVYWNCPRRIRDSVIDTSEPSG